MKKTIKITIVNPFHNTETFVRVGSTWTQLSQSQMRRVQKVLCGMKDCCCGGAINAYDTRGEHVSFDIVQDIYGECKDTFRFLML